MSKKGDPFKERMVNHRGKGKLDKNTTDAIPIAFASKEDVQKMEAVAYWLCKSLSRQLNLIVFLF